MDQIIGLIARLATLALEAAQAGAEKKEEIDAKFKAALIDAASKAGFDFSASDAEFLQRMKGG